MRYIVMHKVDAQMEAGLPPSGDIVRDMGGLVGESIRKGIFLDGAGLHRSATRVRVQFDHGECTVTGGPLEGRNELVSGIAMIHAKSMDEAVGRAKQLAGVTGDAEIDIGPVVEPWDLKMAPKPEHVQGGRFLLLRKADADFEAGVEPAPERTAAVRELLDQLAREGVLLTAENLTRSARGARLAGGPKGHRAWTDGPFAESKEMIAGFSILELPSMAEAKAWADRYAAILDGNEVDVRPLADKPFTAART
jgi:hypothetical protein